MSHGLTVSNFRLENRVDLRATVRWDTAAPGTSAAAEMDGDYSPDQTWSERNGGIAFLEVFRDGTTLRFETWGTDTNGDYTSRAIDIFELPIDLTGAFPQALWYTRIPSPHGVWTYMVKPVPEEPNAFSLVAGRSAGLYITDFHLENRVDLHATVRWDSTHPGDAASAEMTGDYSPDQTWSERNGGIAFMNVTRDGSKLRIETWGTDTNGDYTSRAIDIFELPVDLTAAFPPSLSNTHVPSPHGIWTYVVKPVPDSPYALQLVAGRSAADTPPSPPGR